MCGHVLENTSCYIYVLMFLFVCLFFQTMEGGTLSSACVLPLSPLTPLSLHLIYTTPFIPLTALPRGLRELDLAVLH